MKRQPIHPYAREARLLARLWRLYDAATRGGRGFRESPAVDIMARIHASGDRELASYRHPQNWSTFNPPLTARKLEGE